MRDEDILMGALLEDACLTLDQLASACGVPPDWVARRVHEGLLSTPGVTPSEWRFSSRELRRVRAMRRIERDFDAVPELAALMADLLEEVEELRTQLRRAGFS